MFLSIAVAAVVGPQLGAAVAEGGGDYTVAFVVAAVISGCGWSRQPGIWCAAAARAAIGSRP